MDRDANSVESMKAKICMGLGVLATVFLTVNPVIHAEVSRGQSRDEVIIGLGNADSSSIIGSTEILRYKRGITVTLENGKGVEIVRKGEISGLKYATVSIKPATDSVAAVPAPAAITRPSAPATPPKLPAHAYSASTAVSNPSPVAVVENSTRAPAPVQHSSAAPTRVVASKPSASPKPAVASFSTPRNLAGIRAMFAGIMLGLMVFCRGVYVFFSYCCKRICEKAGEDPGIMIWIPIAQYIPLLRVAQMPPLLVLLFLVPVVNVVLIVVLWAKICSALGKSPWLVILLFVPILNLALLCYLAFSGGDKEADDKDSPALPPVPKGTLKPVAG